MTREATSVQIETAKYRQLFEEMDFMYSRVEYYNSPKFGQYLVVKFHECPNKDKPAIETYLTLLGFVKDVNNSRDEVLVMDLKP